MKDKRKNSLSSWCLPSPSLLSRTVYSYSISCQFFFLYVDCWRLPTESLLKNNNNKTSSVVDPQSSPWQRQLYAVGPVFTIGWDGNIKPPLMMSSKGQSQFNDITAPPAEAYFSLFLRVFFVPAARPTHGYPHQVRGQSCSRREVGRPSAVVDADFPFQVC